MKRTLVNSYFLIITQQEHFAFPYHIDHNKICKAILQMFHDFVGDCQTAFLIWQLHNVNNYYQDIRWYFIILLFSQNFLSVCCTHTLWTHNHSNTHSLVRFIILSVPVVLLKLKTFCESRCTPGAEFTVRTLQSTSRTVQKIMLYKSFVLGHLDCSLKKVCVSTTCEIACCISKQYCSISLNTLKVFLLVLPICVCQIFLWPSLRSQYFFPFI